MDRKLNKLFLLTAITLLPSAVFAQDSSDKLKPRWLHTSVEPKNVTFVYDVVSSQARTLDEARKAALATLISQAGLEGGATVKSDVQSSVTDHSVNVDGKKSQVTEDYINVESTLAGEPAELTAKKIDEYWSRDKFGYYNMKTLYARGPVNTRPVFDDVKITTNYGCTGLWRSAIVPGWGQLYKGSTLKGTLIMGGTVACIGGIIYTDCMRNTYTNKINKTHNAASKREYVNRRDNFTTARTICIGTLGALYIYNLIDAIAAPGAKRILTSPKGANKFSYQWTPAVLDEGSVGVYANFTF